MVLSTAPIFWIYTWTRSVFFMFGNRPFQSLSSYVIFVTINNTCLSSIHLIDTTIQPFDRSMTTILVLSFKTSFSPTTKHFWNSVIPSLLTIIVSRVLVLFKCRNCNRSGLLYKLWTNRHGSLSQKTLCEMDTLYKLSAS